MAVTPKANYSPIKELQKSSLNQRIATNLPDPKKVPRIVIIAAIISGIIFLSTLTLYIYMRGGMELLYN